MARYFLGKEEVTKEQFIKSLASYLPKETFIEVDYYESDFDEDLGYQGDTITVPFSRKQVKDFIEKYHITIEEFTTDAEGNEIPIEELFEDYGLIYDYKKEFKEEYKDYARKIYALYLV